MPGHVAQISARASTKGYVQTGAHARARCPGTKSEQGRNQEFGFHVNSLFCLLSRAPAPAATYDARADREISRLRQTANGRFAFTFPENT